MHIFGAIFGLILSTAQAGQVVKVVDGDSLFFGNKEIRLEGIDAPEYHQSCYDKKEKAYPCGKLAYQALKKLVSGKKVRCRKIVKDKYHRDVSECWAGDININEWMVKNGWAVAYTRYTKAYEKAESVAKTQHRGIWQGRFLKPEYYRILQKEALKRH